MLLYHHPLVLSTCSHTRLYEATGDEGYLRDAESFYERSRTTEKFVNPNPDRFSYENVIPALHLLLYKVGAAMHSNRRQPAATVVVRECEACMRAATMAVV